MDAEPRGARHRSAMHDTRLPARTPCGCGIAVQARTSTSRYREPPRLSFQALSGDVDAADITGEEPLGERRRVTLHVVGRRWIADTVGSMSGDDDRSRRQAAIGIRARTVSGDLRINAPRIEALRVRRTTSGDIRIEGGLAPAAAQHESAPWERRCRGRSRRARSGRRAQTIAGDVPALGACTGPGGAAGAGRSSSATVRCMLSSADDIWRHPAARGEAGGPGIPRPPHLDARSIGAPFFPCRRSLPSPLRRSPIYPRRPQPQVAPCPWPSSPADPSYLYVVAEAEATRDLADGPAQPGPAQGAEGATDRREAARLDILRALERGGLDIDAASHRLEDPRGGRDRPLPGVLLMAADPLDQVLRLVAAGRLSAEEAARILAALDEDELRLRPTVVFPPPLRARFALPPGLPTFPDPGDGMVGAGADAPDRGSRSRPPGGERAAPARSRPVRARPRSRAVWRAGGSRPRRDALAVSRGPVLLVVDEGDSVRIIDRMTATIGRARPVAADPGRALGTRDFRLLWTSEAISLIGDQFHFVALSWLVIDADAARVSPLGTVLIAIAVPRAILLVPFGVRRRPAARPDADARRAHRPRA